MFELNKKNGIINVSSINPDFMTIMPAAGEINEFAGDGNGNGNNNSNGGSNAGTGNNEPQNAHGYELQCCGDYPIRFPYNAINGQRDCCGQKTYNTFMMTCCDGTVTVGDC